MAYSDFKSVEQVIQTYPLKSVQNDLYPTLQLELP